MPKNLIFQDSYALVLPKTFADSQQLIQEAARKVVLRTVTRATHSGALLNQRVYPGVKMRDSVGSWVTPERGGTASYNKPILINHDQHDANATIGRVRSAQYTQLKHGDEFMYDFKRPATGRDHGSGFITLEGLISSKDAIEKILDGRYQTVSTGQRPEAALCNICGFDWLSDSQDSEPCDHIPGRKYQIEDIDYPCYLITGKLEFREKSYVNVPAQQNARTLSANLEALDSLWNGSDVDHAVFQTLGDSAEIGSFDLFDSDGNFIDLIMKDGQEDSLPDIATRFTKTAVSIPEVEDIEMKRKGKKDSSKLTTNDADEILESWIKDQKDPADDASDSKDEEAENQESETPETKDSEEQDTDKDTDTKDQSSDSDKKDTSDSRISDKALAEAIDKLTEERDALKVERDALKVTVDEKTELTSTLTESITEMRKSSTKDAARQLALIRIITRHTGAEEASDSSESFDKLVDSLSDRSADSLNDAITDSLPQLQDVLRQLRTSNTRDVDHVNDPTLHRDENDTDDEGENDGENFDKMQNKDEFLDNI